MLGTALMIGLLGVILSIESRVGQFMFGQPLISSTIVGLLLGNVQMGLKIGVQLQLIWMGIVGIGASTPPDIVTGSILASSLTILTGQTVEVALALAVPVAVAAQTIRIFVATINAGLIHYADRCAERGDTRGIELANYGGMVTYGLGGGLPTFLGVYFGVEVVKTVMASIPKVVTVGLSAAGGMLPGLGFAMILNMVGTPKLYPYFIIGFALATWLKVPMMGMALIGLGFAFLHDFYTRKTEEVM